jgi:beta-phosphoglucomutase-like phosphatase (HAD superfamily)
MDMAFIFDVEGTLVDSARHQLACLHETLLARGRDVAVPILQQYLGMDGKRKIVRLC